MKSFVLKQKYILPLCLAVILLVSLAVGGTLAYLKSQTGIVTNSFIAGNIKYTLSLNANAADANEKYENADVEMPSELKPSAEQNSKELAVAFKYDKDPALEGYTFEGWYYDEECTNLYSNFDFDKKELTVKYGDENDKIAAPNEVLIVLYAKWEPIEYTVVYDQNGDDKAGITGSTASSSHVFDEAKALTRNGYERVGYTFIGWNTQADGKGKSFGDKESVINLTNIDNDVVTLYAQWGAKSYVIRYHANGGSGTMADQYIKYDSPTNLSKNQFTKDDYSLAGWALTPDGEVKYIDEQTVVNLQESGTLDLYAVWIQDSHTVYFDYNGGTGSPASKQFQNGKAYGQLPEYPMRTPQYVSETMSKSYLFTGWYTEKTGGTRVYASTIADATEDHTLYAHWEEAPTNNVIKEMQVSNNPDDNFDGVVDDAYLTFKCSSSFEKFNIPLKGLIPGQTYTITFDASNTASFGDYISGYKNSVYGSYIVDQIQTTGQLIGDPIASDIIADWNDRIEPDGNGDGSQKATNDAWLNGPHKNRSITFTATKENMYWTWDFGLMEDHIQYEYNITNIELKPVAPKIEFGNKKLIIHNTSKAKVVSDNFSSYSSEFTFDGDGYAETMYYPITGLTAGSTYTITFDHIMTGALINSSSYDYGCGISSVVPTKYGSFMDNVGATWISGTKVFTTTGVRESVTLTFTATGSTAYWVWNMANCSDNTNCSIDIDVTNFKANHAAGGNITYYSAPSMASLMSLKSSEKVSKEEPAKDVVKQEITLIWDGIDDTNIEEWYPADEQIPVAGDDYELIFEPKDGYSMSEIITVTIDDVVYEVYTVSEEVDPGEPYFDLEKMALVIPGDLLTDTTKTVAIVANAI